MGQSKGVATIPSTSRTTRILLAYNGSKLSQAALQTVIEQYRPQHTEIRVLYAVSVEMWDDHGKQAQELADRAGRALRAAGFKVETEVLTGAVSDAIVDAAESWRADLIVLGWHGRKALRRFLFGSIADAVTHQAPCSVELVRIRPGIESLAMATPA